MKRSVKDLSRFKIETKDGKIGEVKDLLFDEKQWAIRYVEADFGSLFSSEKVLIPRVFFKQPQWEDKIFATDLATAEIEKCPKIEDHLPVSRKYEEELYKHYRLVPYWSVAPMGITGAYYPAGTISVPAKVLEEKEIESILRSFNEVEGYHIDAINGKIGHVEDLIIDDDEWQILYAVIDTKNWLPWSKKVLIALDWMGEISYLKREVKINLKKESIENAPEYDADIVLDENYEKNLLDYFSMSLIK